MIPYDVPTGITAVSTLLVLGLILAVVVIVVAIIGVILMSRKKKQ